MRGNYRLTDAQSWQAVQDRLIYSFHMPLFFVLAGLFLWNSIGKDRPMLLSPATVLARPFVFLGQASLAIYVAHTVFSAGVRIGLNLIGIAPETAISFAAANVVGLLFPLILWRVALARGWSRWIGFGR